MHAFRSTCLWALLAAIGWHPAVVYGGVFSAIVEKVSLKDRTITVRIVKKEKVQTLDVRASATITVDNKRVSLDELEIGQTVAVTTNDIDEVTKLVVRTEVLPPPEIKLETKSKKKPTKNKKKGEDDDPEPAESTDDSAGKSPTGDDEAMDATVGDWPQFRGPNRDNVSLETGLQNTWPKSGPKLDWKQTDIGQGYSSVAVANGKVYTMGNRGDDEFLIALDSFSGEHLWALKTGKAYHDGTGDGPRGTPTVDGDRVYALGGNGELVCAGAEKGDIVWQINILEEFGGQNIQWGISESVLVDGDHVICTPGGKKATMVALNKLTGKPNWRSMIKGQPSAAYASPIAIDVGDVRQYVTFVHTAVVGIDAQDGRFLWSEQKSANGTANCASPLFADNMVFSASGYGTGGAMVKLASQRGGVKATFAYHTPKMKNHHGGMAVVDGHVYGFDEDVLTCLELKTGKVKWQHRSVGKGSLTVADGKLFLRSENGPVGLAEVNSKAYKELSRFDQPHRSRNSAWSHPVVAGGKLYLRDMDTLLVYDVKE